VRKTVSTPERWVAWPGRDSMAKGRMVVIVGGGIWTVRWGVFAGLGVGWLGLVGWGCWACWGCWGGCGGAADNTAAMDLASGRLCRGADGCDGIAAEDLAVGAILLLGAVDVAGGAILLSGCVVRIVEYC
jgi:hypothetical protein